MDSLDCERLHNKLWTLMGDLNSYRTSQFIISQYKKVGDLKNIDGKDCILIRDVDGDYIWANASIFTWDEKKLQWVALCGKTKYYILTSEKQA